MNFQFDPIGFAIWDFYQNKSSEDIIVKSDLCDDDTLSPAYLLRTFEEMPELEQFALLNCSGKTLDIEAGSGCHSKHLISLGLELTALDKSANAVSYLETQNINAIQTSFLEYSKDKFDTLLLLMNGLGLAGTLSKLEDFLLHAKSLLNPGGKIICDSSDLSYLFEEEDGGKWLDLNAEYFGEMKFNMVYKDVESGWFEWLYLDHVKLKEYCKIVGLSCEIIFEGENDHYLAELKQK
ncbi:MAG: SAM-dependent methyltransferase [Arenicella sp.]|jgi:SAM-dependent methyltransferase